MGGHQHGGAGSGDGADGERPDVPDVAPQLAVTDLRRIFSSMPFLIGGGGDGNLGKTDFEGHKLNDMIDIVQHAKPGDLEDAGDALWHAGGAIRKAAHELDAHIGHVDWEGEAGDAFRKWGKSLVSNSHKLAEFSEGAGTQIKAAGAGLSTVRSAMPPRDTRLVQKDVADIPAPARVKGNKDYDEAQKVEEDRQEAINQMNRLGSYYTVSQQTLAAQEPPTFGPMPDVGVPQPLPNPGKRPHEQDASTALAAGAAAVVPTAMAKYAANGRVPEGTSMPVRSTNPAPTPAIGTDIDSATMQHTLGTGGHTAAPAATGLSGQGNSQPTPFIGGGGLSGTPGIQGMGRPVAPVESGPSGRTGTGMGSASGRPASGSALGRPASTTSARPAGRSAGIVGGKPSRVQTGTNSPRIPRGTVIGNEQSGGAMGRGSAGAGGRPVPAGGAEAGAGRRRLASERGGVVGTPRTGAAEAAGEGREFTPGGSGLVPEEGAEQRPAGMMPRPGGPSGSAPKRDGGKRPDYLEEDEDTWTSGRQGIVPPVIE